MEKAEWICSTLAADSTEKSTDRGTAVRLSGRGRSGRELLTPASTGMPPGGIDHPQQRVANVKAIPPRAVPVAKGADIVAVLRWMVIATGPPDLGFLTPPSKKPIG